MKHASAATLAGPLAPLLQRVRALPRLVERRPGIFYLQGRALLHFHEDPAGLFADLKQDGHQFSRWALRTQADDEALVAALRAVLGDAGG